MSKKVYSAEISTAIAVLKARKFKNRMYIED